MLILTRKNNESIMIGENIKVTILGSTGNKVRIGVSAPEKISVHREEIFELIKAKESKNYKNSQDSGEEYEDYYR